MSVPRKTRLDELTQSQRKRRGRYLEAYRAKNPRILARKRRRSHRDN